MIGHQRISMQFRWLSQHLTSLQNVTIYPSARYTAISYHQVLPRVHFNPFNTVLPLDVFKEQLEVLSRKYSVVPLSAVGSRSMSRELQLAITFDDGYQDNYEVAFPILQKMGIPATFYVVTDAIGLGKPLWDWEVAAFVCAGDVFELEVGTTALRRRANESDLSFAMRVIENLRAGSLETLRRTVEALRERCDNEQARHLLANNRCMSWEQVKTLQNQGMEIGSHTVSHRSLDRLVLAEAIHEMTQSKQTIEKHTGYRCLHFSFPFGHYNDRSMRAAREAGFQTCLLGHRRSKSVTLEKTNLLCQIRGRRRARSPLSERVLSLMECVRQ